MAVHLISISLFPQHSFEEAGNKGRQKSEIPLTKLQFDNIPVTNICTNREIAFSLVFLGANVKL